MKTCRINNLSKKIIDKSKKIMEKKEVKNVIFFSNFKDEEEVKVE